MYASAHLASLPSGESDRYGFAAHKLRQHPRLVEAQSMLCSGGELEIPDTGERASVVGNCFCVCASARCVAGASATNTHRWMVSNRLMSCWP